MSRIDDLTERHDEALAVAIEQLEWCLAQRMAPRTVARAYGIDWTVLKGREDLICALAAVWLEAIDALAGAAWISAEPWGAGDEDSTC